MTLKQYFKRTNIGLLVGDLIIFTDKTKLLIGNATRWHQPTRDGSDCGIGWDWEDEICNKEIDRIYHLDTTDPAIAVSFEGPFDLTTRIGAEA